MRQPRLQEIVPWLLPSISLTSCLVQAENIKQDLGSVEVEYDYIVVGGGTSGLVVASRLSEDESKTVLVVEYGDFADTINVTIPYFTTTDQSARLYDMTSVPQTNLGDRVASLRMGNVVGGSSTVNGMVWGRGSAIDYDSWGDLGNKGWGWKMLLEYFHKSSRFSPPAKEYVKKYGFAGSANAYGDGPIHVGYPSWQWPAAKLQAKAWTDDLGAAALVDGADGHNVGIAWLPQNSGIEALRSSAVTAYYGAAQDRPNIHLLVQHYCAGVKFEENATTGVEITSRSGENSKVISSKNVILAAGAVNTPRILQLSGIGPTKLLESLSIGVVVDAPGVGANFQDQPSFYMAFEFNNNTTINPDSMNDPEFRDAAWDEYEANKTGPFTHTWGNRVVFTSLQDLDSEYELVAEAVRAQDALKYLPAVYADNPALLEGFLRQREVMQSQYLSPQAGIVEFSFGGAPSFPVALQKPLSRGTIAINNTNADPSIPPLIDFNAASNPIDMRIISRALRKARVFMASESVSSLEPVEVSPGPTIESDADIEVVMRESVLSPSFDHPVGTAAMMPRELGGVVDNGLRVYGVDGLWVVDASVMPLLPAAHTQATVYAVAERAAELIRDHGRGTGRYVN